jgi:succinate dehydrogenase / fumarate reductase iron-sulfur subunit
MNQIMRLRRVAGSDQKIKDRNNGYRHEHAFVKNIKRNGILHESDLLADSYGGKFHPAAGRELISGLPTAAKGLMRGKMTPKTMLLHTHKAPKEVKKLFDEIDGRDKRIELNLYVVGEEDAPETPAPAQAASEEPKDKAPTFEEPKDKGPTSEQPKDKAPTFGAEKAESDSESES